MELGTMVQTEQHFYDDLSLPHDPIRHAHSETRLSVLTCSRQSMTELQPGLSAKQTDK